MPHNFTKNFAKKLKNLDKNTCILFSDLVYYLSVRELGNGSVVERHLAKVNVAGSNLVSRSNLFIRTIFFIYAAL